MSFRQNSEQLLQKTNNQRLMHSLVPNGFGVQYADSH